MCDDQRPTRQPASTPPVHALSASLAAIAVLALVALAAPLAAQDDPPPAPLALTSEQCLQLLRQFPSGDADYVPGVTADGQAVAPADLPPMEGGTLGGAPFEEVEIRLLGVPTPVGRAGIDAELRPGTLRVNTRTGRVTLDGRDLAGNDAGTLVRYCTALRAREGR